MPAPRHCVALPCLALVACTLEVGILADDQSATGDVPFDIHAGPPTKIRDVQVWVPDAVQAMLVARDGTHVVAYPGAGHHDPIMLAGLDIHGARRWELALAIRGNEVSLQQLPDGGFAAYVSSGPNAVMHDVRDDGTLRSMTHLSLPPESWTSAYVDNDDSWWLYGNLYNSDRFGFVRHVLPTGESFEGTDWPGRVSRILTTSTISYALGSFPIESSSTEPPSFYVAQMDAFAQPITVEKIVGDSPVAATVDAAGSLMIAYGNNVGDTWGTANGISVRRYNPDGTLAWTEFIAEDAHAPRPVAVIPANADGSVYIAGSAVDRTTPSSTYFGFLSLVDGSGRLSWRTRHDDPGDAAHGSRWRTEFSQLAKVSSTTLVLATTVGSSWADWYSHQDRLVTYSFDEPPDNAFNPGPTLGPQGGEADCEMITDAPTCDAHWVCRWQLGERPASTNECYHADLFAACTHDGAVHSTWAYALDPHGGCWRLNSLSEGQVARYPGWTTVAIDSECATSFPAEECD